MKSNLLIVHLILFLLLLGCHGRTIEIFHGEMIEGQEALKIVTPGATYHYQVAAGGFASILDPQGTDWVQFHKGKQEQFPASAASDYRGLPNLVFRSDDGGCGHPGFDKMATEVIGENKIRSRSLSGKWQWSWTFYPHFAELAVEKIDPDHAYWFLYEGPIAGKFSPATHYWGTEREGPMTTQPDLIKGPELYDHWQTVYFGDQGYDQTFFVYMMKSDTLADLYTYMGNDRELANDSEDGMVVFGFGRSAGAVPLMTTLNTFRIGFYPSSIADSTEHRALIDYIGKL
ncbi:MAG: hypothetical protein AAGA85_15465 [Bacteroidota bacterium]